MPNTLDCTNLTCPQPVIMTRKFIAENAPEQLTVVVDNSAASENVGRFLNSQGYAVERVQQGAHWHLRAQRDAAAPASPAAPSAPVPAHSAASPAAGPARAPGVNDVNDVNDAEEKIVVVLASEFLGSGDDELGAKLVKGFLMTLPELGSSLWRLLLLNGGAKLAVEGSPVLDELRALEKSGVRVMACGTCLEFFAIRDNLAVGESTTMLDVVTSMQLADKVLNF